MSHLLSISLSFLILIQSFGMGVSDILNTNEFIEHIKYHSEQYGDNLPAFISKHYGELKAKHSRDHQEEKEDHRQLPFQHQTLTTSIHALFFNTRDEELKIFDCLEFKKHTFYYQAPNSSIYLEGFFQPPQHS